MKLSTGDVAEIRFSGLKDSTIDTLISGLSNASGSVAVSDLIRIIKDMQVDQEFAKGFAMGYETGKAAGYEEGYQDGEDSVKWAESGDDDGE